MFIAFSVYQLNWAQILQSIKLGMTANSSLTSESVIVNVRFIQEFVFLCPFKPKYVTSPTTGNKPICMEITTQSGLEVVSDFRFYLSM